MNPSIILGLITVIGAYGATRVPNPDDFTTSFQQAQSFYSAGAYDQAIERYEEITRVRSRLMDVRRVKVRVGNASFPVQEAAAYQTGNAYAKLYEEYSRFAAESRDVVKQRGFDAQADSAFARAVAAFRRVIETATSRELEVLAHQRLVDLYYQAKRYSEVLQAAQQLITRYPDSPGSADAYYNVGWSYYHLKDYSHAIEAFQTLLRKFPTGYRADRSLFQIGESYLDQGDYLKAVEYYTQLIDRQHIQDLTEAELKKMRREKLAGLVDETALELAAKAQIRIGTCYTKAGRYEDGLKAYQQVITLFSTERKLVEEAYLRIADLFQAKGDMEASIRTYREAIDRSSDRVLKARVQYALAERFFTAEDYAKAIEEYRIYLKGYADIAERVGFPPDRVRYRMGSSYQQLAQKYIEVGDRTQAEEWLAIAITQYDTLCTNPSSPYALDARFNRGLAYQTLGTDKAARKAVEDYHVIIRDAPQDVYAQRALIQLGELYFNRGDYDRAIKTVQMLLDRYPDSSYRDAAYMRLALSYQAQNDLDRAIPAFLTIPKGSSYFARARLGAGHAYVAQQRNEDALRVLREGLAAADDDEQRASFHYLFGQACTAQGDYRQAMFHFTEALTHTSNPQLTEALRFSRANAAFSAKDYVQAEEDFRWIVDHVQDKEKIRSAENALALCYLNQNKSEDAIRTFARMVENASQPEEKADLLSHLVDLYYNGDDYANAIHTAQQLIALDFPDVLREGQSYRLKEKAYFLLGDAFNRMGRVDEAVRVFQEALERYPDSYFARDMRLTIGTYWFTQGDLDRAKEIFTELLGAGLDAERARVVRFYLANTHYSLREFEEAKRVFEGLLRDYPHAEEMPDILFGLAESHYQLGDFEKALGYYERILREFPKATSADDAQYNMAWCLIELRREEEAMEALRGLLKRYPDSEFAASAQFTLGDYAYNRGDYKAAMEAYRRVQERYPDSPVAANVPRLMDQLTEALAYQDFERGIAWMDSAQTTENKALYEQAARMFQEVLDRYPHTESAVGALSNMGVCWENLGRWRDAVQVYDRVIALYEQKRASREALQFAKSHRDWIVTTRL